MGLFEDSPEALCPWLGGVFELSGVFGGKPSLASSSAARLARTPIYRLRTSTCFCSSVIVSACARIGSFFAALSREPKSEREIAQTSIQIR